MGDSGFRSDLIHTTLTALKQEITNMVSAYAFKNTSLVVEYYDENSSWLYSTKNK
jgi:hypothetical protein